jgi:hypothetical protein
LLVTALEARDRAEAVRQVIAREGMTSVTKTTGAIHVHPLLKVEKDSMALFARCWTDLKLDWDGQIDGRI